MRLSVNVPIILIILNQLAVKNTIASNSSPPKYFYGLLSDLLQVHNNKNDLTITSLCNEQLNSIQNGLNSKQIWAIKRKFTITYTVSFLAFSNQRTICNCCIN